MASAPRPANDAALRADADRFVGALLDAPVDARRPMLDALEVADPALFALVASLLVHLDAVDDFLAEPIALPDEEAGEEFVGRRFGHWRVVRPIGRGGMGLVFEVERADGVVRQRAALKLIARAFGAADRRAIVARFHAERQILAQLDHPGIARLIDAGAAADRPYLVMEFVDGVPLDRWCDERALTIDARIALFARICAAVHYAHQRLVVHRDLKPSNLLVTSDGTPKLLDFGISKLVGVDGESVASAATIDASALLTPRYASPEQLTGAPISTASDIYSLGVLLFELLTGAHPHRTRNDSLMETMRVVATEAPTRASLAAKDERIARRLRGDLDLILAKALAREPGERYDSVAALRDDLLRHLAGDPIEAAPGRWSYRASRFVRKHRKALAVASLAGVAIAALALVATWEAVRAERARVVAEAERTQAEKRFADTHDLAKALLFELDDAIDSGPTKAREQLVRTALVYLDRLSQDRLSPDLQKDVASAYEKVADIVGNQAMNNLGRTDEARKHLQQALAIREGIRAVSPDDLDNLDGLARVEDSLALSLQFAGEVDEAARRYAAVTGLRRTIAERRPGDERARLNVLQARVNEALILFTPGRPSLQRLDDARREMTAIVATIDAEIAATGPAPTPRQTRFLEFALAQLASLQRADGDAAATLVTARRLLAIDEATVAGDPQNPLARRDLALSLRKVGDALLQTGEADTGLAMLRRSFDLRRDLLAADPANARALRDVAQGNGMLANAFLLANRPRDALPHCAAWQALTGAAAGREPGNVGKAVDAAEAASATAAAHLALGDASTALAEATGVVDRLVPLLERQPNDDAAREVAGNARLVVARGLAASGRPVDAFAQAKEALVPLARNAANVPQDAFAARSLAHARLQAATIGLAAGPAARAEACALAVRSRDGFDALDRTHRLSAQFAAMRQRSRDTAAGCEAT